LQAYKSLLSLKQKLGIKPALLQHCS